MVSIKKQLEPKKFNETELHKSAGILDDYSMRKVSHAQTAVISNRLYLGDSVYPLDTSTRTLNLISTNGSIRIRRISSTGVPFLELQSYLSDGTTLSNFWDIFTGSSTVETGKFMIRLRTPTDLTKVRISRELFEVIGTNHGVVEGNNLRLVDLDTTSVLDQQIGKIEFYTSDTSLPGVAGFISCINTGGATTPAGEIRIATGTAASPAVCLTITSAGNLQATGSISGASFFAGNGATGSFTTVDLKTVTVTNGIITSIV